MKKIIFTLMVIITMTLGTKGQERNNKDSLFIANNKIVIINTQKKISSFLTKIQKDSTISFSRESQIAILDLFLSFTNISNNILIEYQKQNQESKEGIKKLMKDVEEFKRLFDKMTKISEELVKRNVELESENKSLKNK